MSYTKKCFTFASSNGRDDVYAEILVPDTEPIGILQISHGMIDHSGRYEYLKELLTSRSLIVAISDHIGHGRTARDRDDLGYLGKDGRHRIVDDLYTLNRILHEDYPNLDTVLFGHSMGSFMARLYAERYPDSIKGVVIHGTGGKNPALIPGLAVVNIIGAIKGDRHRSELVRGLAFDGYNKRFDKSEGSDAWLTSVPELVADRKTDPYTSFTFTVSGYRELFSALGECNSPAHFAAYPKELATLIVSGRDDPVGDFGKGVEWVYGQLSKNGAGDVTLKLYDGARHELFNERERDAMNAEIIDWICEVLARK